MKLPWSKVSWIITDGAPTMVGERSGLSTVISNKFSKGGGNAIERHCIIHQQGLCAKHLKSDHAMKPVVKEISSIYHRRFKQFLLDIQAEYGYSISYRCEVAQVGFRTAMRFFSQRTDARTVR